MSNKEKLYITIEGLKLEVKSVDEKTEFGYKQYLVIPVSGSGSKWVREASILREAKDSVIKKI